MVGMRKDLVERHKRELKRLRDDEFRFGLTALQRTYRDAVVGSKAGRVDSSGAVVGATRDAVRAVATIAEANEALERNPNVALLLQKMLLDLPALR